MALRRNSRFVSEEIHFYGPNGIIGFIDCKLNRGGRIVAFSLKSPIENQGRNLATKVLKGRARAALEQHRRGKKVTGKMAVYIPKDSDNVRA